MNSKIIPKVSGKTEKSFRIGTQVYGIHIIPKQINHVGRTNHKLHIVFKVLKSENSNNDINFYVMNQGQFFEWFNSKLPEDRQRQITTPPKNVQFVAKRIKELQKTLDIKTDGTAYLVFDNRFSTITRKNVDLEFYEEWEEEEQSNDVFTTIPPHDESLKEEIERMIDECKESLMIISPYCDMTMINRLISAKDDGVDIKIILRDDPQVKGLPKAGLEQIKKNFPNRYKLNRNIHSRIIICDSKEAIVSSADLDQKSLQGLLNLGVKISDPYLVRKIIKYFSYVWSN